MTTPFVMTEVRLTEPLGADDHLAGTPSAPVTLIEYGDFQCPYCRAAHPIVQEVLRQRPGVVRFAYRHFPLTNVHPYADLAAEVAESAAAHGQFWPMHDWLFENQELIDPVHIGVGVTSLGLPVDVVDKELSEHVYSDRVHRDFVSGVRSGVNGTPTFYINGRRHDLSYELPVLLSAIDLAGEA